MNITTKLIILAIIITSIFLISCKSSMQTKDVSNTLLLNCWKHSYEEETETNIKIYRPCDFTTFPASRYRNTFTLNENGESIYLKLSPTDAHYNKEGGWNYDSETKTLTITDENNELVDKYTVIEVSENKLVLE